MECEPLISVRSLASVKRWSLMAALNRNFMESETVLEACTGLLLLPDDNPTRDEAVSPPLTQR
jgi:hypothetical protein